MDLIYCPLGKSCSSCDRRAHYTLTDEGNRQFTLRRYEVGGCRFEIFNCAELVSENDYTGRLYDFSVQSDPVAAESAAGDISKQKNLFRNYTKGHSETPIL